MNTFGLISDGLYWVSGGVARTLPGIGSILALLIVFFGVVAIMAYQVGSNAGWNKGFRAGSEWRHPSRGERL